jgi:OFA family oxalate/formate antiporter-like MFS transporter
MTAVVESLSSADAARERLKSRRWVQLILGIICMVMIANLQYGWTLFVAPIGKKFHWDLKDIQWAFTAFVAAETWLVPFEGYLVDRIGPKFVIIAGGVLVAVGWSMNSVADSLGMLYFGQIVGGIGAGAVYGTCVGNALKWFPERRGLAAGLTAAGFGAGSALTVLPITWMIDSSGYQPTFLWFGIGQGVIVVVVGFFLAQPDASIIAALPKPKAQASTRPQLKWYQMLGTPVFWIMYLMFVLMAAGGLFAVANLKPAGIAWGVPAATITLALSLDRITNGITRPFFGWVSDKIGRENTMFIAFALEAIGIVLFAKLGANPALFVVLTAWVFFGWGEIYSLFPSTCADTYGWRYAATNAGALYTAKGTAVFLVPYLSGIAASGKEGWANAFLIAAAMSAVAAIMSQVVLKPMRRNLMARMDAATKVEMPVAKVVASQDGMVKESPGKPRGPA